MNAVKATEKQKKILHVDLDAFFASVEELDHPEWAGRPLAVGGQGPRGILSTCNYAARAFGLHSAMPSFLAKQLCPQLVLVPGRFSRYKEMSEQVLHILRSYTRTMEAVSIDEAYLDITSRPEPALFIAHAIQDEVAEQTGLSVSIGVSYNKFLAKLASEWQKPHGIFEITCDDVPRILLDLSVERIHGIGRHGTEKLKEIGIFTVRDLLVLTEEELKSLFGKQGAYIYDCIRGKDARDVHPVRPRKSIGKERTFDRDITQSEDLIGPIVEYAHAISSTLQKRALLARSVHIKLKTDSFQLITRSHQLPTWVDDPAAISEAALFLLHQLTLSQPIRLIGVSVSELISADAKQLQFLR
ncbi:MAG: DNA polymerase IV [Ndongobacter sp.]|nr:DNA polymerase IV [Ndongobacter sp.]